MGLPPHPLKESLISSLSYMQSYSRVVVVEDSRTDPFLSTHPLTKSQSKLGFIAAASVLMKDVKVGNLCIMDTKAHSNFGTLNQGLLVEFADTIAGIWTDRQQLYQELRRDGVHMQQSVLGVLRPPLVRLIREADAVGHSLTLLEAMWRATTFNQLDKTASNMQKDVNYFEYLVSTAIRVVSLAQIHDGMQMKQPMVNIGAIRGKYVYEFDQEGWRSSMRELIYHYGLLSVWVYSDDKEEFMRCFLAAHPDVLHFCIAAVLGHLYCSNCQQNIHITTSFSSFLPPTATLAKESSVSTKSSETSSTYGRSAELGNQPAVNLANRRKLCIQISSQDRLPPLPKEMRESLDILSRQYLRGQVRQVTNHCFQLLVPVEIDTSDAEAFDEGAAEAVEADAPVADDGSTAVPDGEQSIHSHGALSRHQELQLQQEQQRKQLLQRQKRALFPDLASSLTNPLKSPENASASASLIAETTLRSRQFRDYDDFGDVIDVASGAVDTDSSKESSAQAKLFPSGFGGILALPSYRNIAQTIVDSCRSLLQLKSPSHGRAAHSKVSPAPSCAANGTHTAAKGSTNAPAATKAPPSLPSPTTTTSTVAYNSLPPGHSEPTPAEGDSSAAVGPTKTTPRGGREAMRGHGLRASHAHNKVSPATCDPSSAKGGQFQGIVVG